MADTTKKTGDAVETVAEVPVKAERKPAEKSTKHAKTKLCIHVDLGDEDPEVCRPSTSDVTVLAGDDELHIDPTDDGFTGEFHLNHRTAVVDVVAEPFTCEATCRTFRPVTPETTLQLTRGCTSEVTLTYVPGPAAIQITPRFTDDGDGRGDHGEARDVPGVRFEVFVGDQEDGTPLTRVTSLARPTVSFADLPPGRVTLVVTPPARLGDQPIEPRRPGGLTKVIELAAGQNVVLDEQFEFVPAAGDVTVRVIDDADDRNQLSDIPVRLSRVDNGANGGPDVELTDDDGVARFTGVLAGTYRVELAVDPVSVAGRTWTARGVARAVVVTAQDNRGSVELRLAEDLHLIRGTVFGPDGQPAAFVLVEIRTTPDAQTPFDTVLTDAAGRYEWEAPNAGQFFVAVAQQGGKPVQKLPVVVNSVAQQDIHLTDGFGGSSGGSSGGGSTTTNDDPTPFPLLVGNVDLTTGTAPHGHMGGGGGYSSSHVDTSAGATVSSAIRDVLGYRTKTTDTKGFVAALQRSFSCHDTSGHTVCTWTPRSYASTIPADLGALTGAQASIFERTKVSADSIIPLLDGLTPLLVDADREDANAIRNIVRSRITELVSELSLEGGPRTQRVDELFERLTGVVFDSTGRPVPDEFITIDNVDGELGVLRDRFGFVRGQINLVAEEEDFTNFLIVVDSISSLFATWQQVRAFFDRNAGIGGNVATPPFLGTQLVLISRQLNVITETVQETYFAMDSVFLGAAERQTVLLTLRDEGSTTAVLTTILLSELLDWIDRFAADEGPRLIEDAGTDGINAFFPTIRRLATLATSATTLVQLQNPTIPPTFFTTRVQLALQQLAGQLVRARDLADAVTERLKLGDPPDIPAEVPGMPGMHGTTGKNGGKFTTTRRGGH